MVWDGDRKLAEGRHALWVHMSRKAEPSHLAKGWKTLEIPKLNIFPSNVDSLMQCIIFLDCSLSY